MPRKNPPPGSASEAVICRLKSVRQALGLTQSQLAAAVGIKRQAVYDIESGRYLPNTGVALRLARILGCRVEDLFVAESATETQPVTLVDAPAGPRRDPRLRIVKVRDKLVGYPLHGPFMLADGFQAADGLMAASEDQVRLLQPADQLAQTVLLLGCDPAFAVLAAHVSRHGGGANLQCRFASSRRALEALSAGQTHMGGTHLHNRGTGEANADFAQKLLKDAGGLVVAFSAFEEGLMVAPGNPKGIRDVTDLTRADVCLVNREEGAALRTLLDDRLAQDGIAATAIAGYGTFVASHSEGAQRVLFKTADAALGLRAVAVACGLDFVPLEMVRCDIVVPKDLMAHPSVKAVLDVLQTRALREELGVIPGYETGDTGRIVADF